MHGEGLLSGFEVKGGKADFGESWGRKNRFFPIINAASYTALRPWVGPRMDLVFCMGWPRIWNADTARSAH
jgi:hypothetical protein